MNVDIRNEYQIFFLGLEETVRVVALDRSFHVKCYQVKPNKPIRLWNETFVFIWLKTSRCSGVKKVIKSIIIILNEKFYLYIDCR